MDTTRSIVLTACTLLLLAGIAPAVSGHAAETGDSSPTALTTQNAVDPPADPVARGLANVQTGADRIVGATEVAPGESIQVTITATVNSTRATVNDTFRPAFADVTLDSIQVDGEDATPVLQQASDDQLLVALDGLSAGSTIEVTYTVEIPDDAEVGTTFRMDGRVVAGDDTFVPDLDQLTVSLGEREVSQTTVSPGGMAQATVTATVSTNRTTIDETFSPAFASASIRSVKVDGSEVDPTLQQASGEQVLVTLSGLSGTSEITVVYKVTVADDASVGSTFTISGSITAGARASLGSNQLTVVEPPTERFDKNDDNQIDLGELTDGATSFAAGEIGLDDLTELATEFARGG